MRLTCFDRVEPASASSVFGVVVYEHVVGDGEQRRAVAVGARRYRYLHRHRRRHQCRYWCGMTTDAQIWDHSPAMGQRKANGLQRGSTRHIRWVPNWQRSNWTGCSSPQDSTEQDRQILQIDQHTHILAICHGDSWYMAWDGHWAHARNWQAYHHYHRGYPGDNIIFPTPFHGSAKRKCGFFPQHHRNRVNCRCNHNFVCLA